MVEPLARMRAHGNHQDITASSKGIAWQKKVSVIFVVKVGQALSRYLQK
jgi:hypothetical protein